MDSLELFEIKLGDVPSVFALSRTKALEASRSLEDQYPYEGIPFMLKCPTELLRASEGYVRIPEKDLERLLEIVNKRLAELAPKEDL